MVTAMNNLAGTGFRDNSAKDIHTIVYRRGEFQKRLRDCFYDIIDIWPDVLSNNALKYEISSFVSRYRAFRLTARTVADSTGLPPPLCETLPRYILFLKELDEDMCIILHEFSGEPVRELRPSLSGIARSLRFYVKNVDDEFYERLIIDRLPPSRPLKWCGTKVAATLFAEHFGLTDAEMNRAFLFPSHGRTYRGLKRSSNVATKGDDKNGIADILKKYPNPA